MSRDPDGHYACLGVFPDASRSEIRAAFQAKAKEPRSAGTAPDAATLDSLREARDILTDPDRRAAYDAVGLWPGSLRSRSVGGPGEAAEKVEAVRCGRCGAVSAQPRYAVFPRVTSLLLVCKRAADQGVRCPACAAREATQAALWTWLLGWWSFPGLLRWAPEAIRANLRGGNKPKPANAALLTRQCVAFARRGEPRLAAACLRQAEAFAQDGDAVALGRLRWDLRLPDAAVRDAWAPTRLPLAWARLAPPVAALGLVIVVWWTAHPAPSRHMAAGAGNDGRGATESFAPAAQPERDATAGVDDSRGAEPVAPAARPEHDTAAGVDNDGRGAATAQVAAPSPPDGGVPGPAEPQPRPVPRYAHVLPGRGSAALWRKADAGLAEAGRLPAFATVEILGPAVPGSAAVPARVEVRTAVGDVGQVDAARLGSGDGEAAKWAWCGGGAPLVHNEVATRRGRGPHRVAIENRGDQWAMVKMRADSGRHRTVLAVFVGPQGKVEIADFPSGRFRLEFKLGRHWSRRCGAFLDGVGAQRFPNFNEFPAPPPGARQYTVMTARYTITPVLGGNVRPETISDDEFAAED